MSYENKENYYIDLIDNQHIISNLDTLVRNNTQNYQPCFLDSLFSNPKINRKYVTIRASKYNFIVDLVKPFFEKAGLQINSNNGYVNFISYNYFTSVYTDDRPYDVASQNEVYCGVHSCIIITYKDPSLSYGNIEIYEEYSSFMSILGYDHEKKIFPIKNGMIIVLNGDTLHKIQGCKGSGLFNMIEVIFYKEKREGYQYDND